MIRALRHAVIPFYVALCLLLGGSTRGVWANMILQLLAIAIIAWTVLARPRMQSTSRGRWLALLIALGIGLFVLQLVPLPPGIWTLLPGRDPIAAGYTLLGESLPWLPLSLAPYQTMTSALWLLPPLAVLAGMLRLGAHKESWLGISLVATTFVSVLLGALQVTSGAAPSAPWYLYDITNVGVATGFLANANHMAILLVVTIPFLVALLGSRRARKKSVQASASKIAILVGALFVILLGLWLNGSLAGWGLGVPVVAASLLIGYPLTERWARWSLGGVGLLAIGAAALMLSSPLHNDLTSAGADESFESRRTIFATSLAAAADFAPFGSGVGSFSALYPSYENPASVTLTYVNHVHSDYIEIALETGLAGVILMALLLLWWGARTVEIWRLGPIDHLARAATIAAAALLTHSIVDYPLRTTAMAAVFAMCLGLMVRPQRLSRVKSLPGERQARHLSVG